MRRLNAKGIKVLVGAAICSLFVSCPVEHPVSLVYLESMAMSRQSQCSIQTGGGMQYLRPFGILDLAVTNHYYVYPHYYNNLPTSSSINKDSPDTLGVESNYINILGAQVVLNIPMDIYNKASTQEKGVLYNAMTDGYFVAASGGLKPDSDGVLAIEAIPPTVGKVLRARFKADTSADPCLKPSADVYAYITLKGRTVTGYDLSSNEFMFPVKLCWGCLVRYVSPNPKDETPQSNGAPCLPGQDEAMTNVLCTRVSLDKKICDPESACSGAVHSLNYSSTDN